MSILFTIFFFRCLPSGINVNWFCSVMAFFSDVEVRILSNDALPCKETSDDGKFIPPLVLYVSLLFLYEIYGSFYVVWNNLSVIVKLDQLSSTHDSLKNFKNYSRSV